MGAVLGREERVDMRKLLIWSAAAHLVLILAFSLFSSIEQEEQPRDRIVKLVLHKRVVSKDIVPDAPADAAPGTDKSRSDSIFDESFFRNPRKFLQDRSRNNDTEPRDRSSRDQGDSPRYDNLLKSPADKHGRLDRSSSPNTDDYPGRKDLSKDRDTRTGDHDSLGRDALSRRNDNRNPLRDNGSRRTTQGNQGSGLSPKLNVSGRWLINNPKFELPPHYKQRGLSYSANITVVVTPQGQIISASIERTTADPELDLLLVRFVRRYLLNEIKGDDQTGTISIRVQPQ